MSFIGLVQRVVGRIGPWYIHGKNIGTFLEACGFALDQGLESLELGLNLSNPKLCDVSAFPALSKDRRIRLYPSEPEESKRARLAAWLQLHRQRGTHQGELRHAQPYFLPDVPLMRIVHQSGHTDFASRRATWHTLDSNGVYTVHKVTPSNWNYDNQFTKWSRWWVIIYAPASLVSGLTHWDDGSTWDGGQVYDGVLTQGALDIVQMFLEWHGAHSRPEAIILATDPASFDPTATAAFDPMGWSTLPVGNWGSPIIGGTRTRPPSAVWLYEHGP
jgi:hypothetical protein